MKQLSTLVAKWSHAQFEADHFREGAFLTTVGLMAVLAWLWVGQVVASEHSSLTLADHETRSKSMPVVWRTHREDSETRQAQVLVSELRCDHKQVTCLS